MQNDGEWYWSLTKHCVVKAGEARNDDVLGPYPTRDEAEGALDRVKARNDALAAQEEAELTDEEREKRADRERFGGPFGF